MIRVKGGGNSTRGILCDDERSGTLENLNEGYKYEEKHEL